MPVNDTPASAVQRLLDGQCAMAIGWLADGKNGTEHEAASNEKLDVGVIPLPGSTDVFNFRSDAWEKRDSDVPRHVPLVGISGRLGSLTQDCRQPAAAAKLLLWLSGTEMGAQISSASPATGPFRNSHLAEIQRWTGSRVSPATSQQYAEAIQLSLSEPNALIGLRIPGRPEYLAILADAVREAVAQQASADETLAKVSEQWRKLTESLGSDAQRAAYMRSVGME
jgi:ABC-type glycerol-3-phosphate transport system substrate-binding protein